MQFDLVLALCACVVLIFFGSRTAPLLLSVY
ncbi:hypothetical protein T11_12649 [Trichinella zimbabwensis]|uniref:Uncharacterized protein n=1 Tax=Trichinella zimbabwensis TaxID=268475 RepID=A0A0V1EXH8_9BILA|nr:hypothetical protein T11_12649 [Trichinella zimbabwensis]